MHQPHQDVTMNINNEAGDANSKKVGEKEFSLIFLREQLNFLEEKQKKYEEEIQTKDHLI